MHLIAPLLCRYTPEVLAGLSEPAFREMVQDLNGVTFANEEGSAAEPLKKAHKLAFESALLTLRAPTQPSGLPCQIELVISHHAYISSCNLVLKEMLSAVPKTITKSKKRAVADNSSPAVGSTAKRPSLGSCSTCGL